MAYIVYILLCADGTLYTGCTNDIERRLREHNNSKRAAAYTKSRRPVRLVWSESAETRSDALKREYAIKNLSKSEKMKLIRTKK